MHSPEGQAKVGTASPTSPDGPTSAADHDARLNPTCPQLTCSHRGSQLSPDVLRIGHQYRLQEFSEFTRGSVCYGGACESERPAARAALERALAYAMDGQSAI